MAKYHGKSGSVKAVTTGGTPAAVGEVKSFDLNTTAAQVDASKIGSEWEESLGGLKGWTGSMELHYDPADPAQPDLVEGAEVDLELYPIAETTGNEFFSGTAWITDVKMRVDNESVVNYDVSFKGNGALTRDTVPA